MTVVPIVVIIISACFYPDVYVDPLSVRLQLAGGNAVCEQTARTAVGRQPRWTPFLRERFIPATAADAVSSTYLRDTLAGFRPT